MMRSLFSGISGLRNHQTRMDVIGNNVSNVNTTGFKASRTIFQDIFSQTLAGGMANTAAEGGTGGTNPIQVGLGIRLSTIDVMHTGAPFGRTDNPFDMMIENEGFFIVEGPEGNLFTRVGNFGLDSEGYLVTSEGMFVLGFTRDMAYVAPVPGTTNEVTDMPILLALLRNALSGANQPAFPDVNNPEHWIGGMPARVVDPDALQALIPPAHGFPHPNNPAHWVGGIMPNPGQALTPTSSSAALHAALVATFDSFPDPTNPLHFEDGELGGTPLSPGSYQEDLWAALQDPAAGFPNSAIAAHWTVAPVDGAQISTTEQLTTLLNNILSGGFPNPTIAAHWQDGLPTSIDQTVPVAEAIAAMSALINSALAAQDPPGQFFPNPAVPAHWQPARAATGLPGAWDMDNLSRIRLRVDEFPGLPGTDFADLLGFNVADNGMISVIIDNRRVDIAQLALALFANNNGLERAGNSLWRETASSGDAVVTTAMSEGAGTVRGGGLEMSNVDLASEFTDMIVTQRGYQANSRIITVSDSLLEELVNLKR